MKITVLLGALALASASCSLAESLPTTTTFAQRNDCVLDPVPIEADSYTEIEADFDGDGRRDRALTYRQPADPQDLWWVRVELAAGGGLYDNVAVNDYYGNTATIPVKVITWSDVDGDRAAELWIEAGHTGASTRQVAIMVVDDCTLRRPLLDGGDAPLFAVGGDLRSSAGILCGHGDGITIRTTDTANGITYTVFETQYLLEGAVLRLTGTRSYGVDTAPGALPPQAITRVACSA